MMSILGSENKIVKVYFARSLSSDLDFEKMIHLLNNICHHLDFQLASEPLLSKFLADIDFLTRETPKDIFEVVSGNIDSTLIQFVFTLLPFEDNYFNRDHKTVNLVSFANWSEYSELPFGNGVLYFVANIILGEIMHAQGVKDIWHDPNIGCLSDFLMEKTGIDSIMREPQLCQNCLEMVESATQSTPFLMKLSTDCRSIIGLLGKFSHINLDVLRPPMLARDFSIVDRDVEPALGVFTLAKELASVVEKIKNEPGTILGVFGRWGRGKSYLLEKIYESLSDSFIRVDFHAWKYRETESSLAYLYENLVDAYSTEKEKESVFSKFSSILKLNLVRLGSLEVILLLFSFLLIIIWYFILPFEFKIHLFLFLGLSGVFGLLTLNYKFKPSAIGTLSKYSKKFSFKDKMGFQAELIDELILLFKCWLPSDTKDTKRVLLVVDDLDRCSLEQVVNIIEAVKIIQEEPGICEKLVVFIAVDYDILHMALEKKFTE